MGISKKGGDRARASQFRSLKTSSDKSCCPFLKTCTVKLTRDYFLRVCNTNGFVNCHHLAKKIGELKTPVAWPQKLAVESDIRTPKQNLRKS